MVDTARALKMADRVKVIVAEMLETRVKDPRLGFITITDARMTGDLQHATVFYTVLGSDEERAATAAALESAKGVLRSEVGKQTGLRLTPTLEFLADAVPENASHIDELLPAAAARDAEVAALAAARSSPVKRTPTGTTRTTRRRGRRGRRGSATGRVSTQAGPRPSGRGGRQAAGLDPPRRRRPGPPAGRHPQVGHAGTLDPMATGVLVLGVGRATRLLTYWSAPTRRTPQRSGSASRPSPTTPRARCCDRPTPRGSTAGRRRAGGRRADGQIQQRPSAVSAIKVDGRRAYARVRAGEEVELAARPVTVERFEVLARRDGSTPASPCSTST